MRNNDMRNNGMRNNEGKGRMRNNDMRNNDARIDNITQLIGGYDDLLDTAILFLSPSILKRHKYFERNAATITIQKIRGILGMEGYQPGAELNKRGRDIA
jgi:hypothetical protein